MSIHAKDGQWFRCSFCHADVKSLYFADDGPQTEERGLCDICLETVPHDWVAMSEDAKTAVLAFGEEYVLLKAANFRANRIERAIEEGIRGLKDQTTRYMETLVGQFGYIEEKLCSITLGLAHRAAPEDHRAREAMAGDWIRTHEAEGWKLVGHDAFGVFFDLPSGTTRIRSWLEVRGDLDR